ncbi:MAG: LysM peptidoglycan-binding domain-containing protein [Chloroflexota bacterium]
MNEQTQPSDWRVNVLLTGGVMLAVLMALLMAQVDGLQIRLHPTPEFIALAPAAVEALPEATLPAAVPPTVTATTTAVPLPTSTVRTMAVSLVPRCGAVPADWAPYQVRAGDSLLSLSAISGTTPTAIVKANCIQNEFVFEGMIIFLPVRPPTLAPCGPPAAWVRYVVQFGDTLSSLARRTGSSVYAIMQANCMDSTYLTAGRTIYLPRYPYTTPPIATNPPLPTHTSTPTLTATPILVSPTASATAVVSPSPTATILFTATATSTATPLPTDTPTTTAIPNTPTNTPEPPTATATIAPTATHTPEPPTATATIPPSATPEPPTATSQPPTATAVPSATP